jgi:hypothetical protein
MAVGLAATMEAAIQRSIIMPNLSGHGINVMLDVS